MTRVFGLTGLFLVWLAASWAGAAELTDHRGKKVPITQYQRVVSGAIVADEIINYLGPHRPLLAYSPLVANPLYSSLAVEDPRLVAGLPRFPDWESLVAMEPDLVVMTPFSQPEVRLMLENSGARVFVLRPLRSWADLFANIADLGRLLNRSDRAKALVNDLSQRLKVLQRGCGGGERLSYINYSHAYRLMGAETTFDSLVMALGGRNLGRFASGGERRGPWVIGVEPLLGLRPQVVVAVEGDESIWQRMGWSQLPAVVQRRVVRLPAYLYNSASHTLVAAAESVCQQVSRWPIAH